MTDLHPLVDRATADLAWDADRVVAAAAATGRTRLRRRRAGAGLATCLALGAVGGGWAVAGQGGEVTRGVDPAAHAPSTPSPTPSADATTARWRLAVTADQVPATFASILPGEITTLPQKESDDAAPIVDFQWDGYAVRVALTPDDYVSGRRVIDPQERCREGSSGQPCVAGEVPGSWQSSMTSTAPAQDGGATTRLVWVYYAQGWDVLVMESNAATDDGPPLTPDLPLTLEQLQQIALSPDWFR